MGLCGIGNGAGMLTVRTGTTHSRGLSTATSSTTSVRETYATSCQYFWEVSREKASGVRMGKMQKA